MHFKLSSIALFTSSLFPLVALAAPMTNVELVQRDKLQTGTAYTAWNKGGWHQQLWSEAATCHNFGDPYADSISSIDVLSGFDCYFFVDVNCENGDNAFGILGPSYVNDLSTLYDGKFNDKLSSWRCHQK
ncbi:hypothetical protein DL96DRAFT_1766286 [Flagelloscypha sp. PMI_526]|nr:hypothetical protein DL96DRAFT_1766286 [Flagelloscypha sp. PMI_526]